MDGTQRPLPTGGVPEADGGHTPHAPGEWSGVVDPDRTPAGLLLDLKTRKHDDLDLERLALRAFHAANPHLGPPPFEREEDRLPGENARGAALSAETEGRAQRPDPLSRRTH